VWITQAARAATVAARAGRCFRAAMPLAIAGANSKNPPVDSAAHRWIIAVVAAAVLLVGLLLVPWSRGEPSPTVDEEQAPAAASKTPEAVTEVVTAEEMPATERERVEPTNPPPAPQLERAAVKGELRGRVLLETRTPANGARVRIGAGEPQMEPDGSFVVQRDQVARGDDLVATLEGYEPAVIDDLAQTPEFRSDEVLEIVLPGRALTIDGWLVEKTGGAPCEGWQLELYRGTDCGLVSFPNMLAEDLAAGGRAQKQDPRMMPAGPERVVNPNLQKIGKDGTFRIAGLRRGHDYVLRAWNERTLRTVLSEAIPAGATRYVFTVPNADFRERVWGRVVDRRDMPIADVRVRLTMRVHEVEGRTSYQTGGQVRSGPDGSFEFKAVPRENLLLRFDGKDVDSYYHELPADDPGVNLQIRLACLCRFRYEALPGVATAASLRVLDANEKPMRITRQLGQGSTESNTSYAIENGRSPDLMVSDTAAWLLLQTRDGHQRRVPMPLSRGDITIVRG